MEVKQRRSQYSSNGPIEIVGAIKNGAELTVMAGLFAFIGSTYNSPEATLVSYILKICLGAFVAAHIQRAALSFLDPSGKHFKRWFVVSAGAGLAVIMAVQFLVLVPVLAAVERQLRATPPALPLQADPSPAGTRALPSPSTAAPKPAAAPSAATAAAPAPTVPPSAGPNRSSSPEARKPD